MEDLNAFIKKLLDPKFADSFYGPLIPSGTVEVLVYETPGEEPQKKTLKLIFPFMTILDLKIALYNEYGQDDRAHPDFVFLAEPKIKGRLATVDYKWSFPSSPKAGVQLFKPTKVASGNLSLENQFADANGSRRDVRRVDNERMIIEDMFPNGLPVFHAFFYSAVEPLIPGERPVSELDWNNRLYPYFPKLSVANSTITAEQRDQANKLANNFHVRSLFFLRLEKILRSTGKNLAPVDLSKVKYIRLDYAKPANNPGIEVVFYQAPVNNYRPYMRLIPVENTAISKIHMLKDSNIPNIEDPRLFYNWSQEKSPTPERNYAMAKILLRKKFGNTLPLYATLRLFDDGTANIIVTPPKVLKQFDPIFDLKDLGTSLTNGLNGFPYLQELPVLGSGNFIFTANVKNLVQSPYTHSSIRNKLPLMSAVFQEIPPAEDERPMITLRYKLVSNFNREDRIQSFITQLLTLKPVGTSVDLEDRIQQVSKEFQISYSAAKEQLAKKMQGATEFVMTDPDTKDYAQLNNAGVDIAIYAKHPVYFFNVYRADSYTTVQRIISFLSILFSIGQADFKISEEEKSQFVEGDRILEERASKVRAPAPQQAEAAAQDEFESLESENAETTAVETTTVEEAVDDSAVVPPEDLPDYMQALMGYSQGQEQAEEGPAAEAAEAAEAAVEEPEPVQTTTLAPVAKHQVFRTEGRSPSEELPKKFDTYFSTKLKEADAKLFNFHITHPDLTQYVTSCGANLTRQPAVLSYDQYEAMKEEYSEELSHENGPPVMQFFKFPMKKDAKVEPYNPGKESYTIMEYGSSPVKNYYLCSRFFCVRDEMLVREVELRGTKLRPKHYVKRADGTVRTTKEPNTCPMCEGGIIMNRRFPGTNNTVLERTVKANTKDSRHTYIGFLKRDDHPDGLYLPCCFTDDQPFRYGDKQFPLERDTNPPPAVGPEEAPEALSLTEETVQKITISYEETLLTARTASIVGAEKMPLDPAIKKIKKVRKDKITGEFAEDSGKISEIVPPQIGILPPLLNEYFSQNPIDLVSRTFNPQKLKPNSEGFLRVGVENRGSYRGDSFLSAIAPYFHCNSTDEIVDLLYDIIQPRLFMGLNFGNLLLEFYTPNWVPRILKKTGEQPTTQDLRVWASSELKITHLKNNEPLVRRAYLSYDKFCWWLFSDKTVKEYRHFAHLLSLPGILPVGRRKFASSDVAIREYRRPGILFIVLDILSNGELKVRCPPYPVGDDHYKRCDIAFILRHHTGIWEPIFHYNNDIEVDRELNEINLTFPAQLPETWPPIVKQRFNEFRQSCSVRTGSLGIYSSSLGLNSRSIYPLYMVKNALHENILDGILRDSYNHVAGLVYKTDKKGHVVVPVIEDGISYAGPSSSGTDIGLILDTKIIFDWDDFVPARIEDVIDFYKKFVDPHFSKFYKIERAVENMSSEKIVAVQLTNGIYIPVLPVGAETISYKFPDPDSPARIQEMEWRINKKIAVASTSSMEEIHKISEIQLKEINEAFEHLRITFSNWLNSGEDGGNFRRELEETLSDTDLPLFERRKRVEIMLSSTVEDWISEKNDDKPFQPSLLRVDCLKNTKEDCKNMCAWSEDHGKCLIHAPKKKGGDGNTMSTADILLARLIEELLRFSNKRREIFDKRVSQLGILDAPIRQGEEYIIPEKSFAWTELLRLEWAKTPGEKPLYLEEMRQAGEEAVRVEPPNKMNSLPTLLENLFEVDDPRTPLLRVYPSPTGNFLPFLTLFGLTARDIEMKPEAAELSDAMIRKLVLKSKIQVLQIDLRVEPPVYTGNKLPREFKYGYVVFVVGLEYGPSIIVKDTEHPGLLKEGDLPAGLASIISKLKVPFVLNR